MIYPNGNYLFFGGPWDGHWSSRPEQMNDGDRFSVPVYVAGGTRTGQADYTAHRLVVEGEEIPVMVAPGLGPKDVWKMLFENYGRARK